MAKLVWAFKFILGPGCINEPVRTGYSGGLLTTVKKFPLNLSPRMTDHAKIIKTEYEQASSIISGLKD